MEKLNFFQIVLLVVFGFAIILSVLAFSGFLPGLGFGNSSVKGEVFVWGTFPKESIGQVISVITSERGQNIAIKYEQKDVDQFDRELVEALASGVGPDLIIITDTLIARHSNKIAEQPFTAAPLRTYLDTFVDGANIFLTQTGILAYPLVADPLVLYFNKDALARAGYADTPRYWSQLIDGSTGTSPLTRLTQVDERGNIMESAIGLGDYGNVDHAKDIITLLLLQSGNPIITRTSEGKAVVALTTNEGKAQSTAVLNFFTQFSNPAKTTYTWNSSLPSSRMLFGTGKLALYLGFASERGSIAAQNAHLNFDIAEVPQRDGTKKITVGRLYGIARMKQSKNPAAATLIQQYFSSRPINAVLSAELGLPPLRRDLLSIAASDPNTSVYNKAVIALRTWPDPEPVASYAIFGTMIQSMLTGQVSATQAVERATKELEALIK